MLNGFVLISDVVSQQPNELTDSGIYQGKDETGKYPAVGTVVSAPDESECGIKKDMQVVFMFNASTELKIDGKTFRMIGEKSLMGFVDNES